MIRITEWDRDRWGHLSNTIAPTMVLDGTPLELDCTGGLLAVFSPVECLAVMPTGGWLEIEYVESD